MEEEKTHHCVGFDLPTALEAFEHYRGHLTVLKDYGYNVL